MFKFTSLFIILFLFLACVGHTDVISPELKQAMENNRDGEFRVIVEMHEQFDVDMIRRSTVLSANQDEAKNQIFAILEQRSSESQAWLRNLIENVQRFQRIENVHYFWLVNAVSFRSNADFIRQVAQNREVKSIYLDEEQVMIHPIPATDSEVRAAWGVTYIKAPNAHARKVTGKGVTVAVVDTGVDLDHKGFSKGQVLTGLAKSFVSGEATADDGHGHGTHCAGTIGSLEYGVAPDVKILPVKVLSQSGSGTWEGVMEGVQYAAKHANIMSMSLGGTASANGNVVETAVKNAIKANVICVIAAGNSGPSSKTIGTPGVVEEAITVGAIDNKGTIANFSSRGPTVYNKVKPDIVAPGVNVPSLWMNGGTNTISGTSMATPHVAGLVALILSTKNGLSPAEVKTIVMTKAFGKKQANVYGEGCVDADESTK